MLFFRGCGCADCYGWIAALGCSGVVARSALLTVVADCCCCCSSSVSVEVAVCCFFGGVVVAAVGVARALAVNTVLLL